MGGVLGVEKLPVYFMEWISVKDCLPKSGDRWHESFVIAFHTVYGVGVAFLQVLDEDTVKVLEEDFNDKYICSFTFIKSRYDRNDSIDIIEDDDIFEHSHQDPFLGTITHWMPLPTPPTSTSP